VARAAGKHPVSRRALIAWLRKHLVEVADKIPGFGVARMVSTLRRVCDEQERAAAEQSFDKAMEKMAGSRRRLDEALEKAAMCIDLRGRQAEAVTKYLSTTKKF